MTGIKPWFSSVVQIAPHHKIREITQKINTLKWTEPKIYPVIKPSSFREQRTFIGAKQKNWNPFRQEITKKFQLSINLFRCTMLTSIYVYSLCKMNGVKNRYRHSNRPWLKKKKFLDARQKLARKKYNKIK